MQQFANERELKNRPANLFVASFIGEPPMNLLETTVRRAEAGFRLTAGSGMAFDVPGQTLAPAAQQALAQAGSQQEWNAVLLSSPEWMQR